MPENFGASLSLDITSLKAGINEANRLIRNNEAEFRASAATMDDWTKSEEGLTARQKTLNSNIDIQKQKIADLVKEKEAIIAKMKEEGKSDEEIAKAIDGVNKQIAQNSNQLDKMKSELNSTNKKLDEFGNENSDAAKETKNAGEEAKKSSEKMSKLGDAAKAAAVGMAAAFAAVTGAAAAATKALTDAALGGAEYADSVLTESTVTGIATDKLQEYQYAAELVDVSTETLTKSMAKNIKSMKSAADGSASMQEAYKKLGVSVTDSNGELRDGEAVYWELIDALGKVDNETERDALAMSVLGKSAQELNPLIEAGAGKMQELGKQAQEAGYVMSEDALNAFGDLDDQMQKLDVGATAAKNALGTVLLPVLTDLAGDGVDLLGQFTNGVLDANGDIEKIGSVIEELLPQVLNKIIEYTPLMIELVGSFISAFTEAILKGDNLQKILSAAGEVLKTLSQGLLDNLPKLLQTALDTIRNLAGYILDSENIKTLIDTALEIIVTLADGIAEALPTLIPSVIQAILTVVETLTKPENLEMILDAVFAVVQGAADGILTAIPMIIDALPAIITNIITFLTKPENIKKILKAGIQLLGAIIQAVPEIALSLIKALPQIGTAIKNGLSNLWAVAKDIGGNLVRGLWQGISDLTQWVIDKVKGFGDSILGGLKSFFGIHSPSSVMADQVGTNLGLGVGEGFKKSIGKVNAMVKDAASKIDVPLPAINGGVGGNGTVINQYNTYSAPHSDYEIYKSEKNISNALKLVAIGGTAI